MLVFARKTDSATARLLRELRDAVREHRKEKLFAWLVLLTEDSAAAEQSLEEAAYRFAAEHGATTLPISVLGDPLGPPGYKIAPEAAATVLMFRSGKVIVNRAYRAGEWTPRAAGSALKELPKLLAAPADSPR